MEVLIARGCGSGGLFHGQCDDRDVPVARDGGSAAVWFSYKGKVTRVVDGDTLIARIDRRSNRVRLIGINAPELGACYAVHATAMARSWR